MPGRLNGKVAIVTGGGRGIGRATALELARHGAAVAVIARNEAEVLRVADEAREGGVQALGIAADIAQIEQVDSAVALVAAELGPPDMLVNNAAILGPIGPLDQTDAGAWAQTIEINVIGAMFCLRSVLPDMLRCGAGRVVNVSSGAAKGSGILHASAYSTSKAALDMLARAADAELWPRGIAVNTVYPGVVDTTMQSTLRKTPAERFGEEMSARFRGFHERGELLDASLSARLIVAVLLSELHGEAISIRDERAAELLNRA